MRDHDPVTKLTFALTNSYLRYCMWKFVERLSHFEEERSDEDHVCTLRLTQSGKCG
jgi:hypothetical protein